MKYFRRMLCVLVGHNYMWVVTGKIEREYSDRAYSSSAWGWKTCMRCEHEERFQYDD
jgi:hypothetical protein